MPTVDLSWITLTPLILKSAPDPLMGVITELGLVTGASYTLTSFVTKQRNAAIFVTAVVGAVVLGFQYSTHPAVQEPGPPARMPEINGIGAAF